MSLQLSSCNRIQDQNGAVIMILDNKELNTNTRTCWLDSLYLIIYEFITKDRSEFPQLIIGAVYSSSLSTQSVAKEGRLPPDTARQFYGAIKAHEKILSHFLEAECETLEMELDTRSSNEKSPNFLPCGHDYNKGNVCGAKNYSE
ncbi:hypothetical protein PGT21_023839 [Puccinia graminis f. sp. tritici]|uniref:Uncharacterized protein n=1 Tax=Puccinia graminis f. sp. tritici TaxID=56615 RepID=A0A5B0M6I7_PUCGR|nr:hypothetical protein PGTUg99_020631 [Puccinia graminis f. sp. tritici]KAA1071956.1 hypothetical protein PGT21_023839 [Puccinia graminis f. sp. tritici]